MANWGGTYAITAGATGTLTSADSTHASNSAANWPTGAQGLTNFQIRLLTGAGSPATVPITANTSTQVTVASWPNGTPSSGTTYEIVLLLKDQDHVIANFSMSANIITELQNSATILVDGLYSITMDTSSVVRWNKSESTLVTFCANNRTVQGKNGFWTYPTVAASKIAPTPQISYIRVLDCGYPLVLPPSTGLSDGTSIHHIWGEAIANSLVYSVGTLTQNLRFSNYYGRRSTGGSIATSAANSAYTQLFENIWTEQCSTGGATPSVAMPALIWERNSVFKYGTSGHNMDIGSGKEFRVTDTYQCNVFANGTIIMGASNAASAGSYRGFHNNCQMMRVFYGAVVTSSSNIITAGNDIWPTFPGNNYAIDYGPTTYVSAQSLYDYIAGTNTASYENIDTTAATTSTASPVQYRNLTAARTPKLTPNFVFTMSGVVVGTPTSSSVTITFDSDNGADAGQQTTVTSDSNLGQPILNVASSAQFFPGMQVEVGYGTVRYESARVLTVGAGTITLDANLTYSHTGVQADVVSPLLRQLALPFIKFGTSPGVYTMFTPLPPEEDWGLYFVGMKTTYNGVAYTWKRIGHSVTLSGLQPSTSYYFSLGGVNPLGQNLSGAEYTFTTTAAPGSGGGGAYTFIG